MGRFFSLDTTWQRGLSIGGITALVIATALGSFFLEFDSTVARWNSYDALLAKAYALEEGGDVEGALELAQQVRHIEENRKLRKIGWIPLGLGPVELFEARIHEARLLGRRGWLLDAEAAYRNTLSLAQDDYGADSGQMAYTLYYFGKFLATTGRAQEAHRSLSKAEAIVAIALAEPPPSAEDAWLYPWVGEKEHGAYGNKFQRERLASWIKEVRQELGIPRNS